MFNLNFMDLKIIAVGGYSEVGKNMTAVKVGDEYVILDCGFHLPSLVEFDARGGKRKNLTILKRKNLIIV